MGAVTGTIVNTYSKVGSDRFGNYINEVKSLVIMLSNTADATDTVAITLADKGINTVLGILAFKETTDSSVIVTETDTTSVSAGILTVTIAAGTDNDPRTIIVFYI
jgi:hypothetical protein